MNKTTPREAFEQIFSYLELNDQWFDKSFLEEFIFEKLIGDRQAHQLSLLQQQDWNEQVTSQLLHPPDPLRVIHDPKVLQTLIAQDIANLIGLGFKQRLESYFYFPLQCYCGKGSCLCAKKRKALFEYKITKLKLNHSDHYFQPSILKDSSVLEESGKVSFLERLKFYKVDVTEIFPPEYKQTLEDFFKNRMLGMPSSSEPRDSSESEFLYPEHDKQAAAMSQTEQTEYFILRLKEYEIFQKQTSSFNRALAIGYCLLERQHAFERGIPKDKRGKKPLEPSLRSIVDAIHYEDSPIILDRHKTYFDSAAFKDTPSHKILYNALTHYKALLPLMMGWKSADRFCRQSLFGYQYFIYRVLGYAKFFQNKLLQVSNKHHKTTKCLFAEEDFIFLPDSIPELPLSLRFKE